MLFAGAKAMVLSLWKVPERETRELLFAFYEELAAGHGKLDALRRAKRRLRRTSPLPYYWGGFVLVGDPGKLAALSPRDTGD
jgi:CHAT domain-containing protein